MPYTQTPLSQALFKMFENLDSHLERKYDNLPSEAVKVYLFGGCAIHLHIGTRASNDVDADLQLIQRLNSVDILQYGIKAVSFDDEEGD